MNHTIVTFLKFGEEKHILDLYENGTVYLNTIEYFRKLKDNKLRGDKYEGTSSIINSLPGSFVIPNLNHTVNYKKIHVKTEYKNLVGNLYSLYCVSFNDFSDPNLFKIDDQNNRFGTHCIMIKEPETFINGVAAALNQAGYKFSCNFIEYYDKSTFNGDLTLFHKPVEFEYQKEFRFSVENQISERIKLNIGSIKDYSEIFKIEDIMHLKLTSN